MRDERLEKQQVILAEILAPFEGGSRVASEAAQPGENVRDDHKPLGQ